MNFLSKTAAGFLDCDGLSVTQSLFLYVCVIQFVLFTIVDAYLSCVLERLTYSSESTVDSFFTLSTITLACVKYLD